MRVAIYTRISTDEEHQPYSLEAQDTRLGAYIASQDGWELTRRYSDRMTGQRSGATGVAASPGSCQAPRSTSTDPKSSPAQSTGIAVTRRQYQGSFAS